MSNESNAYKLIYCKNSHRRKKYPPIIRIYFIGAESTTPDPDDVTELFMNAEDLYENFLKKNKDDIVPIYIYDFIR